MKFYFPFLLVPEHWLSANHLQEGLVEILVIHFLYGVGGWCLIYE